MRYLVPPEQELAVNERVSCFVVSAVGQAEPQDEGLKYRGRQVALRVYAFIWPGGEYGLSVFVYLIQHISQKEDL